MRYIGVLFVLTAFMLTGCFEDNKSHVDPYKTTNAYEQITPKSKVAKRLNAQETKLKMEELKSNHKEKIASIEATKATRAKELEFETSKVNNHTRLAMATQEHASKLALQETKTKFEDRMFKEKSKIYQQYLLGAGVLLLVLLLAYIIVHNRNQKLKSKIHKDELSHEKYMQASKQHHERISKTLEIIADDTTDKNIKKNLLQLLKNQGRDEPKLLS